MSMYPHSFIDAVSLKLLASLAGKGLLILGAGLVLSLAMKKSSAARKHWIWLLTLVIAALVPVCSLFFPAWKVLPLAPAPAAVSTTRVTGYWIDPGHPGYPVQDAPAGPGEAGSRNDVSAAAVPAGPPAAAIGPPDEAAGSGPLPLPAILASLWLGGTVCCLGFVGYGMLSLIRLSRGRKLPEEHEIAWMVAHLKREMGVRLETSMHLIRPGAMPMVWALRRGHIYLPEEVTRWPGDRLAIVLLHELAHLKRRDTWALLAGLTAVSFHWFNPLAWIALKALRDQQEIACDDLVLSRDVRPSDYADQILEMSSTLSIAATAFPASAMAKASSLHGRIAAILDGGRKRSPLGRRLLASTTAGGLLLGATIAIISAAEKEVILGRGRILDRNGVVLAEDTAGGARRYPYGALATYYIGVSLQADPEAPRKGQLGIEEQFENELAAGKDVPTTLDIRMQAAVDAIFRETKVERGAAIVMDPRQGDILASISFPDFDLNQPAPEFLADVALALRSPGSPRVAVSPCKDRVYSPRPPGSLFQLISAISASQKGMGGNRHECAETGGDRLKCWVADKRESTAGSPPVWGNIPWHGVQNMEDALKNSCDGFFNQLAVSVGIKSLEETSHLLLPVRSGLKWYNPPPSFMLPPLNLKEGTLPYGFARQVKDQYIEEAAMGKAKGSVAAPIHMVTLISSIANGGKLLHPRYSTAIEPLVREDLLQENISYKAMKSADLKAIREGLRKGMTSRFSPSFPAFSDKLAIVGKGSITQRTTPSGGTDTFSWFIGYTPAENPKYAVAVMIENPLSTSQSGPALARQILEKISGPLPEAPLSPKSKP